MHQIKNGGTFVLSVFFFHFSRDFTIDCLKQSKRHPQNDQFFKLSIFFCICAVKMILTELLVYEHIFVLRQKFWSWPTSFLIFHHLNEISLIFKKNDLKWGVSVAKWSCPTTKFFCFFWTSKTYLLRPWMIFWYLNYPWRNALRSLILHKCHHLFFVFLS